MLHDLFVSNQQYEDNNLLVSASFEIDPNDSIGILKQNLLNFTSLFLIDGRNALRCSSSKGVRWEEPNNQNTLIRTRPFTVEFEIRYDNVSAFKHDLIFYIQDNTGKNIIQMWNREQTANKLIVLTPTFANEASPALIEETTPVNNVWRKYCLQRKDNNTLELLVNDIKVAERTDISTDITGCRLLLGGLTSTNAFNGYARNFKFWDGVAQY